MKTRRNYKKAVCMLGTLGMLVSSVPVFAEAEAPLEMKTADTQEEELKVIGKESDKGFQVKLTNKTGMDILGVSVKEMEEEEYPDNFLEEEDVFQAEEERILYYDPDADQDEEEAADGENAEEPAENEKLLTPGYDIELTFEEDKKLVLHAFPFEDLEEAEIYLEDEVAFIKYTSKESEEELSTKEAELAILDSETQQYEEPAYEEPAYEEPSYEEPAYQEPAYQEPVYQEPVYQEPVYQEPAVQEPAYQEPVQGGEGSCLEGGLLY